MKWIVVVEDDLATLHMVEEALESEGYGVRTCTNGAALVEALYTLPDLIFLDIFLHYEDGRELCRQIKTNTRTRCVPVILSSVYHRAKEGLEESHADNFLKKPFHLTELLALAQRYT